MALIQADFKADTLQRRVRVNVVLPVEGAARPDPRKKKLKTLYLLHGIFGDANSWLINSRVARWAEEKNLCVVMPDGENGFYIDHPDYYNLFSTYIGQELVEATRRMFPLSEKREDTFIGGFSMGGYGALRTGLKFADTFGVICAMSSALILDEYVKTGGSTPVGGAYSRAMFGDGDVLASDLNPSWLVRRLCESGKPIPSLYLSCGDQDFLLKPNRDFDEELKALGVKHTFRVSPGAHDWDFWETEMQYLIRSWLPLGDEALDGVEEMKR